LHGIVGIVRRDVLVLRFDAGKDSENGRAGAELITEESGAESVPTVKGLPLAAERALIVVAAEGANRAETEAGPVKSIAEGLAGAHIALG